MKKPAIIVRVMKPVIDHVATGANARDLRMRHGLSLRAVATAMGFSPPHVVDLEKGRRGWTDERAAAFEKAVRTLGGTPCQQE